jgi:LEA14-like dessication related protein
MDKIRLALRVLSIVILVVPLVGILFAYSNNISGLVVTPEIKNFMSGDVSESQFQRPVPAGQPQYDPATGQYTFSFKFTNPLENTISVDRLSAEVYCKDHNVALGSVSMLQPITIQPGETVIIYASGTWTQQALEHFACYHCGLEDDDINVSFKNLNIDLAGIKIHMDILEDAGWVMMPK